MSSSRSIAAARNRRSGDASQPPMQIRPNKSIASQAAFAAPPQNIKRPGQPPQMQQQQQMYQGQGQGQGPVAKLSVSDAIGLVTLRLGRLETFMFDAQAGVLNMSSSTATLPDNTELVDKSVMTSVVQRIEYLEKKDAAGTSTFVSSNNVNGLQQQLVKCEADIKELKEILSGHILKFERILMENEQMFDNINASLGEIEGNLTVNASEFQMSPTLDLSDSEYEASSSNEPSEALSANITQSLETEFINGY